MKRWVLAICLPLAACAGNGGDAPDADGRAMERTGGAVQSAASQTYRGVGDAVTSPLRDLNLTRREIPVVLLAATDNPYQTRTVFDCPSIAAEVAALDLALGPDLDTPTNERTKDYYRLGADEAAEAALDAARDAAEGLVPLRSWVRQLSGAKQNEKRTKEAIYAGSVRRAFLKGIGEHRGCAAPAAPLQAWYHRDGGSQAYAADPTATYAAPPVPPLPVPIVEPELEPAPTGDAQPAASLETTPGLPPAV